MKICLHLCSLVLLFTACSLKDLRQDELRKLENQTVSHYASLEFKQDVDMLPKMEQNRTFNSQRYKKHFFRPWHSSFKNLEHKNFFWSFALYTNANNSYYFYNKQIIPLSWFEQLIENANIEDLGKIDQKALVIQNTISKNIPTSRAILKNPFLENEGIPFDYANDSILNAGTPILVSHFTKDKRYAFVLSEVGTGFIQSKDLEFFSNDRAKIYEKLNFLTPLKEKLAIFSQDGQFFFESRIGAIYPYYKEDKEYFYGKIGAKKYKISKKHASKFPLIFNDENLKNQLSEIITLPYGWGGYNFERDCSLFTRDIFSAFGLYLPRNSAAQKNFFTNFDISMLSNAQKKDFLRRFAKAYLSLLYLPGHIMLYAGEFLDTSIAIHSIWGLRRGVNERLLIGSSIISTLEIGKNTILEENLLLSRLKQISFIDLDEIQRKEIHTYLQLFNQ